MGRSKLKKEMQNADMIVEPITAKNNDGTAAKVKQQQQKEETKIYQNECIARPLVVVQSYFFIWFTVLKSLVFSSKNPKIVKKIPQ